ncbi:MAG: GTPase domain-containing protein [Planctomycetaceae bacterium]|jgi:ribosome biogenesis GTPase A|nr:GTPase domain-containing protein [Planctomycetaceae bacterium]
MMEFSKLAQSVLELDRMLDQLRILAESCGVPSPEHEDWYALLKQKLIPQLSDKMFLIVAVTGGTNTGKSLIFNHLVGESFSAVDHRASGTKHPVCLVPKTIGTTSFKPILARHFESFQLIPWSNAEQPLSVTENHHLFWSEGCHVPDRLLLLDTPDVDSDREINWERARAVRHAADVLIAVLTEQKYNDAAVRKFFREASEANKPMIVLFNMFDLNNDIQHLPRWLEQFCEETGTKPLTVLVTPYNKEQAERLELPFYELQENGNFSEPVNLEKILTELHFDTIKSQTLLGALKILKDPTTGVWSYLDTVQKSSLRFAEALQTLENVGETVVDWPGLPTVLLAEEIRNWWHSGRPGWSQNVNNVYRTVGSKILFPVRKVAGFVSSRCFGVQNSLVDPLLEFDNKEHQAITEFISRLIARLEKISETENPVLRREILELVGGEHRAALFERAHTVLTSLEPVNDEFRATLRQHLTEWSQKNPKIVGWIRSLDSIATAARPMITVTFAMSGFALGAHVVSQMIGEVAVAGGVTAGGEAILYAGSENAQRSIAQLFRKIQEDYVLARSKRFYEQFYKELWHDVIDRFRIGAGVAESEIFKQCQNWTIPESVS